jgi:hypothetical protein
MAATADLAAELAARIAASPTSARDRTLPVDPVLGALLPDAGLVRGRTLGCAGPAAWTLACCLVAEAVRAGSWLAVIGAPDLGIEAAAELGVPLERMVVIDVDGSPAVWAERVAAAADGFEVILTGAPTGAERVARRVRQRVQSNGSVLVAADVATPTVGCDLDLVTTEPAWAGIGQGHGRLVARRVRVRVAGRRAPRPVERELLLPDPDGRPRLLRPAGDPARGNPDAVAAADAAVVAFRPPVDRAG